MTDRGQQTDGIGPRRLRSDPDELVDRLEKLRILLPAFAQEAASARREAASLRAQNATLQRRIVELETQFAIAPDLKRRDA